MSKRYTSCIAGSLTFLLLQFSFFVIAQKQPVDSLIFADAYADAKRYEHAYRIYSKNSSVLNSDRQFRFAETLLYSSKGKPERLKEAFTWYKRSADSGYQKGIYGLMLCYMNGYGVAKDSVMGLALNEKLVTLDYTDAVFLMALRYEEGYSVVKDKKKAVELFTKAANNGHDESAYRLGQKQLTEGSGTGALYWFNKSYDYIPSMYALATMYDKGTNMPKHPEKALSWYHKITKAKEYNSYKYPEVRKRIREIGATEPSTKLDIVKPVFLKLLSGAANNYNGLISEETWPLDLEYNSMNMLDITSTSKYYTCTIDLGFKNALIRERKVREAENKDIKKIYADYKIVPGTYYSYKADIINSVTNEKAISIYNDWVSLIKAILPNVPTGANSDAKIPAYAFYASMSNGKKVTLTVYVTTENLLKDNDYEVMIELKNE
jgi:hypothetical protein